MITMDHSFIPDLFRTSKSISGYVDRSSGLEVCRGRLAESQPAALCHGKWMKMAHLQ